MEGKKEKKRAGGKKEKKDLTKKNRCGRLGVQYDKKKICDIRR